MTDREKAIVMAYTGYCMLAGDKLSVFYEYVEGIMGRPVYTHEMAIKAVDDEIKEKSKADFMALCVEEGSSEKPNKWIPVSERLPGWHWETAGGEKFWVGERVLACVKEADEYYDLVGVATYGPYGWESSDEDFCSCYASKPVIAWMPLPLPYKQEVEE